jgi:hypothetical protein
MSRIEAALAKAASESKKIIRVAGCGGDMGRAGRGSRHHIARGGDRFR